jgi:hypothetical protein
MRGKIRAATRFNKFRESMLLRFKDDASVMSDFIAYLRVKGNIDESIRMYCDESESLYHLESGPPTAVYQVLRLVNKPVLLRDLEVLAEHLWNENVQRGKPMLYTALSVLYSVNLIDYTLRDFNSVPSNVVQFFIKEDE